MNILQIISKNDRYGAQRVFLDQVRVLRDMGNNVVVVARGDKGYVTDSVQAMGVPCYGIPMKGLKDIFFLRRLVKNSDIDVIHTSLDRADYFGVILSRLTQRPVVSTMHVRRYHGGFLFASMVIVSSRQQEKTLIDKGIKAERVRLIRPGVDTARFSNPDGQKRERWKHKLGLEKYSIVFCHISSLHRPKAHLVSLDLIAECRNRGEHPLLIIVGDPLYGEYYESLLAKIEELGLRDSVHFTGWTEDIPEILSFCHFTLLPSVNEALGMVLLEGMAAGTPIIAKVGEGGAELIEEYGTGVLYRPEEGTRPLAEKLVALFRDKQQYQKLSSHCRETAMTEFSLDRFGKHLMEIYRGLLARS